MHLKFIAIALFIAICLQSFPVQSFVPCPDGCSKPERLGSGGSR